MKINNQYNFPTQLKNELVDSPASNLHCCQYLVPVYQFQTCPQAEIKIFQIFLIKYQIIYLWRVCSWSRSWVHDSLCLIREGLSVCSDSSLVYNENQSLTNICGCKESEQYFWAAKNCSHFSLCIRSQCQALVIVKTKVQIQKSEVWHLNPKVWIHMILDLG